MLSLYIHTHYAHIHGYNNTENVVLVHILRKVFTHMCIQNEDTETLLLINHYPTHVHTYIHCTIEFK